MALGDAGASQNAATAGGSPRHGVGLDFPRLVTSGALTFPAIFTYKPIHPADECGWC